MTPFLNREIGHLSQSQLAFITYVTQPMLEALEPALPNFCAMVRPLVEHNCLLYQRVIAEGTAARFKTIGVNYAALVAKHGAVTDDLRVED